MGFGPRQLAKTYLETLWRVRYSLLTIAAMLALGNVTKYSGADATLGLALARTGWFYPFFGTLLGWLGVALTGSDTSSNVLFGSLQKITAEQTGLSPILMVAANSSGGVMGKMVDAQSIVVASTATNWYGHEGSILRYVFFHSLALAALMGLLVFLQAYVVPFSRMVVKKIEEFLSLKLPLDIICTSHGVVWRENPAQIVERYLQWARDFRQNQVTVVYDTMWNATRAMAEHIAHGIESADPEVTVKLYNSSRTDKNDVVAEIFKSKAVVCGSPTVNRGVLTSIAGLLDQVRGLGFKAKKAAVFGSYGWSGESTAFLSKALREAGFSVVDDGLKIEWNPTEEGRRQCEEYGSRLARAFAE